MIPKENMITVKGDVIRIEGKQGIESPGDNAVWVQDEQSAEKNLVQESEQRFSGGYYS